MHPASGKHNPAVQVAAAIGSCVRSFLGPSKSVKYLKEEDDEVSVTSTHQLLQLLNVEHPVGELIASAVQTHHSVYGCYSTTMVVLLGYWCQEFWRLANKGYEMHALLDIGEYLLQCCINTVKKASIPVHMLSFHQQGTRTDENTSFTKGNLKTLPVSFELVQNSKPDLISNSKLNRQRHNVSHNTSITGLGSPQDLIESVPLQEPVSDYTALFLQSINTVHTNSQTDQQQYHTEVENSSAVDPNIDISSVVYSNIIDKFSEVKLEDLSQENVASIERNRTSRSKQLLSDVREEQTEVNKGQTCGDEEVQYPRETILVEAVKNEKEWCYHDIMCDEDLAWFFTEDCYGEQEDISKLPMTKDQTLMTCKSYQDAVADLKTEEVNFEQSNHGICNYNSLSAIDSSNTFENTTHDDNFRELSHLRNESLIHVAKSTEKSLQQLPSQESIVESLHAKKQCCRNESKLSQETDSDDEFADCFTNLPKLSEHGSSRMQRIQKECINPDEDIMDCFIKKTENLPYKSIGKEDVLPDCLENSPFNLNTEFHSEIKENISCCMAHNEYSTIDKITECKCRDDSSVTSQPNVAADDINRILCTTIQDLSRVRLTAVMSQSRFFRSMKDIQVQHLTSNGMMETLCEPKRGPRREQISEIKISSTKGMHDISLTAAKASLDKKIVEDNVEKMLHSVWIQSRNVWSKKDCEIDNSHARPMTEQDSDVDLTVGPTGLTTTSSHRTDDQALKMISGKPRNGSNQNRNRNVTFTCIEDTHTSCVPKDKEDRRNHDSNVQLIYSLGPALAYGSDQAMQLAMDMFQNKLKRSADLHMDLNSIHLCSVVGPSCLKSHVQDGLILPITSNQVSTILKLKEPNLKILLVGGDIEVDYHHLGYKESLRPDIIIKKSALKRNRKQDWYLQAVKLLKQLNINVLVSKGSVDSSVCIDCLGLNILLVQQVSNSALQTLSAGSEANIVMYILDANEKDVGFISHVEALEGGWSDSLISMRPTNQNHLVKIETSGLIQTAVFYAPSLSQLHGLEDQFLSCIHRLNEAFENGTVLPGAGLPEVIAVNSLAEAKDFPSQPFEMSDQRVYKADVADALQAGFKSYLLQLVYNCKNTMDWTQGMDMVETALATQANPCSCAAYSVVDCIGAKISAWETAWTLMKLILLTDVHIATGLNQTVL